MPRLLVISCGAGAGHDRAAEAVDAAARMAGVESEWFDSLRYTGKAFRTVYGRGYVWLAGASPALWGLAYRMMGRRAERPNFTQMMRKFDAAAYPALRRRIDTAQPDAIVCTHFFPANIAAAREDGRRPPVYTVITDLDVHRFWVGPGTRGYFVGSDEVAWQLRAHGVPEDRIRVTGIPIHPVFEARRGRDAVRRELGIDANERVVLLMAGGFGMGDVAGAVERMLRIEMPFRLLVVAGKNERLRAKLDRMVRVSGRPGRVFGFVTNVHDLMEAADLMVSKSGGLATAECLARALPLVVYAPVPGQEERNADYLMEHGVAVKAPTADLIDFKVREVLEDPDRMAHMRSSAAAIARPSAARDVVRHVLSDLKSAR